MAKKTSRNLASGAVGGKAKKRKKHGGGGSNSGAIIGDGVNSSSPSLSSAAKKTSVRATTHKGRRVLAAREPQLVEELKSTLMLYGKRTSQLVKDVMADLGTLKRGECLKLTRKNEDLLPFEDPSRLEALARKADAGLFVLGSHSKKRPHTLTFGRIFDGRLLDALELHLSDEEGQCKLLRDFGSAPTAVAAGHKPCLFFAGGAFDDPSAAPSTTPASSPVAAAKSILTDLFRGRVVSKINLAGVDRVIAIAAAAASSDGTGGGGSSNEKKRKKHPAELCLRQFAISLKKSGTRVPRVQLTEVGPSIRASVGRFRQAPPDLWKAAMKVPEGVEKRKEKNVSSDLLDGRVGRVYVPRQDLAALPSAVMKGAKRERRERRGAAEAEEEGGGGGKKARRSGD